MCVLAKPKIDLMKHNFSVSGFQYPTREILLNTSIESRGTWFTVKKNKQHLQATPPWVHLYWRWTSLGKRLQFLNLSYNLVKNGWKGFEQVIPGVANFNGDESQGSPGKIASFFITWKANLNNCGDAPSDHGQCLSTMCIHLLSLLWVYEPQKKNN